LLQHTRYAGATAGAPFRGAWHCLAETVQTEGVLALQRGWLALFARNAPMSTATLVLWEALRKQADVFWPQ
jgi:hypothetical protein